MLFSYTYDVAPLGADVVLGPGWWHKSGSAASDYYRLTLRHTLGGNTNLLVEQQIANVNTTVPMDWGSGSVSTVKAIPAAQVIGTQYWVRVRVYDNAGTPTFRVKVWANSGAEPSDTPGTSGTTIVGQGGDLTLTTQTRHGGIGFRGQKTSSATNTTVFSVDNFTAKALS